MFHTSMTYDVVHLERLEHLERANETRRSIRRSLRPLSTREKR